MSRILKEAEQAFLKGVKNYVTITTLTVVCGSGKILQTRRFFAREIFRRLIGILITCCMLTKNIIHISVGHYAPPYMNLLRVKRKEDRRCWIHEHTQHRRRIRKDITRILHTIYTMQNINHK